MNQSYVFIETETAVNIKTVIEDTILELGLHRMPQADEIGGYDWMARRGKYQGSLVKRLNKWIKTELKSNKEVDAAKFGSRAGLFIAPEGTKLRLSETFDWEAGDFGDESSCFWKSASLAKDVMKDYKVRAVQAFTKYQLTGEWMGVGRCWMYPIHERDSFQSYGPLPENYRKDGYLLFNAYGKNLWWFANFIDRLISVNTKQGVDFESYGVMYINNDQAIGINLPTQIYKVVSKMGEDTQYCERCDQWRRDSKFYTTNYGDSYCQECRRTELRQR